MVLREDRFDSRFADSIKKMSLAEWCAVSPIFAKDSFNEESQTTPETSIQFSVHDSIWGFASGNHLIGTV